MSQKTLLMIAYHFPPENAIGGARPHRLYKYAASFGWKPVVVTAAAQDRQVTPVDVHHVPDPFLAKPRSKPWHLERVIRRFAMPGEVGMVWSRDVSQFCATYIDRCEPGTPIVLYSTFPPLGTHLAAMQLLRQRRVHWVADFRDPYTAEPSRRNLSTALSRILAEQIERKMIALPSLIIANTDAAADEWKHLYPHVASKVKVIWNGYDPAEDLLAPKLPERTRKVLIHTGVLYAGRNTGPILASLARLNASVLVRFVGICQENTLIPADVVASGVREGWIEIVSETLPRLTAIEMARQADSLFLIQPQSDTQVPGKLFDYIRIGRPILAFIRQHSPIEQVLRKCGIPNVCIYPDDSPDRVDKALLQFLSIPSGPYLPSEWFHQTFDGIQQTKVFCSYLDGLPA